MPKTWWEYFIDPDTDLLGLKSDGNKNVKPWINGIIQKIDAIESHQEAVHVLFVINQKIGLVKGLNDTYHYSPEAYRKLEITVKMLLQKRLELMQQIKQERCM